MEAILIVASILAILLGLYGVMNLLVQLQSKQQVISNTTPHVQKLLREKTMAVPTPIEATTPEPAVTKEVETPQEEAKDTVQAPTVETNTPLHQPVHESTHVAEAKPTMSKRRKFVLGMIFRELWQ